MKSITIDEFRSRFELDRERPHFRFEDGVSVYRAKDLDLHRDVALKIIREDAEPRRYPPLSVLSKLFQLEHGHLVRYFDFVTVEKDGNAPAFDVLVMDHISGGNFSQFQGAFITEQNRARIVEGMLAALDVLHQNGIFHGNLKPGNVLFQDIGHPHVRLSDYGFIEKQEYERIGLKYDLESVKYLAPEQIEPDTFAHKGRIRQNVDFWSLGILIYELYTGKYVFGDLSGTSSDLMTRIIHGDLPDDIGTLLPENYAELVKACLVRHPSKRPGSVDVLRQILEGGKTWQDGRIKKIKRKKQTRRAPAPLPKIKCKNCGQLNKHGSSTCAYCDHALFGPESLRDFRRPGPLGFWAMFFMTCLFVPIGFLYYDFYDQCFRDSGVCDLQGWLEMHRSDFENEEMQVISLVMAGLLALCLLLSGIFYLIWYSRVSRNLDALGSLGRKYSGGYLLICFLATLIGGILLPGIPLLGAGLIFFGTIFPLMMLQEAWRGSNPDFVDARSNWKKSRGSFMIFSWWLSSFLLPVSIVLPFLPTSLEGRIHQEWYFLTISFTGIYWLLSMLVVVRTNRRQTSKFRSMARQGTI